MDSKILLVLNFFHLFLWHKFLMSKKTSHWRLCTDCSCDGDVRVHFFVSLQTASAFVYPGGWNPLSLDIKFINDLPKFIKRSFQISVYDRFLEVVSVRFFHFSSFVYHITQLCILKITQLYSYAIFLSRLQYSTNQFTNVEAKHMRSQSKRLLYD